ncbi:hypothetical protein ASPZODRAFT_1358284 [Penicilliopsis zonata CBS 506.65]|uniref:CID domain-containing protein n=1 Tax=Penicilliopsis zonata CBS 506.65 TaxID=1073090 RepID=A0A1L9SPA2_9EURO|nr:hypothetical protein ASPZODRAFT_1358284 [Penicilliopsis zonata CBS 506.65]OJJ48933.1 hypothetical protein ASPZODRAFT_1358284 [Penicilliopsis zonata CBS 506.65]
MASHQIAIAKASLSAALLRPDPTSVSRDEITALHSSLDRVLTHCSPSNIQTCKTWILNWIVQSSNRVGVWGKYLVTLATSFAAAGDDGKPAAPRRESSPKRKRLHILYLLNDLFHHAKYHSDTPVAFATLSGSLQPCLVDLVGLAASYDREKNPKLHRRLDDLLDIWEQHGYCSSDYIGKLREVVKTSASTGSVPLSAATGVQESIAQKQTGKDAPFVMPSTHGDLSTPYYDLPAGNFLHHIIPDSTTPLRPETIKPLQFLAGPADEKLVTALKTFLKDVDRIYGVDEPMDREDAVVDIDELGQTVVRDSKTGEIMDGETYYGWSRTFCEQMKKRNDVDSRNRSHSRSRSRTRSRSRSSSYTRTKRLRRYSASSDSEHSRRSRSRSRRRLQSRSSSPQSRERSYSPRPASSFSGQYALPPPPPPPPANVTSLHPPPPPALPPNFPPSNLLPNVPPPPNVPPMPFPPGDGQPYHPGFAPGMMPVPPPRPANYHGPWPPPPPMPPVAMNPGTSQSAFPPPFVPFHPLPPGQPGPPPNAPGQPMPPGSHHFPPPHTGWRNWR